jgi:hypothetical protein
MWRSLERVGKAGRRACVMGACRALIFDGWGRVGGCPSDLTDDQWAVIEALVPAVRSGGCPAEHARRRIVEAILWDSLNLPQNRGGMRYEE